MKSGLIDGVTTCCGYDFGTDASKAKYCPICGKELVKKRKMRVWHIPQVPGKPFYVPVENEKEAKKFLDALAGYDIFQFNNNIKPDFSNASGVEVFDEEANEWCDWYIETQDDYFEDIDEFLENDEDILDDDYIKEVNVNYWAEEEEMKAGIHPSQIIERVKKVLDESGTKNKITFMDYKGFSGERVGVSVDGNFYGVFDYVQNVFENTPESRFIETLKISEMGNKR